LQRENEQNSRVQRGWVMPALNRIIAPLHSNSLLYSISTVAAITPKIEDIHDSRFRSSTTKGTKKRHEK
jgi:hypothetical protein